MQPKHPEAQSTPKVRRRRPNLEQIRRVRTHAVDTGTLWSKSYHELTPEEIAALKVQFFARG